MDKFCKKFLSKLNQIKKKTPEKLKIIQTFTNL